MTQCRNCHAETEGLPIGKQGSITDPAVLKGQPVCQDCYVKLRKPSKKQSRK